MGSSGESQTPLGTDFVPTKMVTAPPAGDPDEDLGHAKGTVCQLS